MPHIHLWRASLKIWRRLVICKPWHQQMKEDGEAKMIIWWGAQRWINIFIMFDCAEEAHRQCRLRAANDEASSESSAINIKRWASGMMYREFELYDIRRAEATPVPFIIGWRQCHLGRGFCIARHIDKVMKKRFFNIAFGVYYDAVKRECRIIKMPYN